MPLPTRFYVGWVPTWNAIDGSGFSYEVRDRLRLLKPKKSAMKHTAERRAKALNERYAAELQRQASASYVGRRSKPAEQ